MRKGPDVARFAGAFPFAALPTTVATLISSALQSTNKVVKLGTLIPFSMNVTVR